VVPALIFVAFLFPLTLYCLSLALINRRPGPTLVPGTWDFVGVVFAASGFLLLGGPSILTGFNERWRLFWLLGRHHALRELSDQSWYFWLLLSLVYYFVVVVGIAWLLKRRRALTAVYNVEPEVLERTLARVLERLGYCWAKAGSRLFLRAAEPAMPFLPSSEPAPSEAVQTLLPPTGEDVETGKQLQPREMTAPEIALFEDASVVELEPFPLMRHVTLNWEVEDSEARQQIETELSRALAEVRTPENPAGGWFLSLSISGFFLMFGLLFILLFISYYVRH
jgi:hypothetical protein